VIPFIKCDFGGLISIISIQARDGKITATETIEDKIKLLSDSEEAF
jgi:hypothetical protein